MIRHLVALVTALVGALFGLPTAPMYAGMSRTVIPLSEGFETGLRTFIDAGGSCAPGCLWSVVTSHANTGTYAVYADDPPQATEQIVQPVTAVKIPSNATSATLSFWHLYDFESDSLFNYDGGVLEVSTDDGMTWSDAGANITAGGYTGTISDTGRGNPLAGRSGWIFTSPAGWAQVTVDILPYRDASFKFRWGLGSDNRNIGLPGGWWIDDVQVSYDAPSSCRAVWGQESPYPIATYFAAAVSLNGYLYVFGGHSMTTTAIANAYRYFPDTNVWSPIASLPEPRYAASAVTDGRYIYILGGTPDSILVKPTLWRYDPEADSYTTLTPFGTATAEQAAAYVDGVIYRIGGQIDIEDRINTNTVEAYTIATDSWTAAATHPLRAHGLGALALDGYVYTAGGRNAAGAFGNAYRYDPGSNTWDDGAIADLPGPAGVSSAGVLLHDTWIVLTDLYSVLAWNPHTNTWRSLDQMREPVLGASAAVIGPVLYAVGGSGETLSDALQLYIETDCATPTVTPSLSPTVTPPRLPTVTPSLSPTITPPLQPVTPSPLLTATRTLTATPSSTLTLPLLCVGDCAGAGAVTIANLITGVAIALGAQPLDACPSFDANQDDTVAVSELIAAVNNALQGCPTS